MFKYLLLKDIYKLSDVESFSDMAFKYFLGLSPEDSVIEPSSLTKFRKLRIKDERLLDLLITKSVQIALEHSLIKSKILIMDATILKLTTIIRNPKRFSVNTQKSCVKQFTNAQKISKKFPSKPQEDNFEDELRYIQELVSVLEKHEELITLLAVSQKLNYLKEAMEDDLEHLGSSVKEEDRLGHKSADSSFYGYKEHLAMTDERVITACVVTSSEKSDSPVLEELFHKSKDNGVSIEAIVGDKAHSGKDNIQFTKKECVHLVAKLHPAASRGFRRKEDEFFYNKDAGLFVCPEGHMVLKKAKIGRTTVKYNSQESHCFDIKYCQICPSKCGT